ncbi:Thioredoxin [Rikenella microfusus]|uniref:Thioredoxin n=2 Tax=Rikenella microfusus TaxID=28139 RepID=A0A379MND5_9BACT|nr:Thioredoxin [Rikenella microfusus]
MIMKKLLMAAVAALMFTGAAIAQTGTRFTEDTFVNVQKAAEQAKKPIFVDIYTTWCGPCKYLANNIFPTQVVGDYMNATFVNAKFDAEKGEGIELAKKYAVKGYPTMLILDSKGEELGRLVGSSRTPEDFVQRLKDEMAKIEKK